ncbi:MAG TPA: hypothetical protein DCY13_24225, partial [Verrucomicrobiales bacterium]|nr:hypothetical protein [Verrucomicrobiales bacterium]
MDDRTASKAAQLWTYIALRNYPVPSAPATEVAQKGIRRLWRRLRPSTAATAQAAREVRQTSSEEFFGELFRRPEWEAAAATLATAIEDEQSNGVIQQVFVGGPHRCTSDMLRHLARSKEWPVLEGPGADAILEGQFERPDVPEGTVVIIPQLAHWFLRHNDGLDTIRRLVDWLLSARQRAVLGCHSWAWRYLEQAIQIGGAFFEPRVLAPLDAAALKRWLGELATVPADRSTVFREASTGRVVLD